MQLRYYQSDLLNSVSEQWAKGLRNVLMMAPTGAGKTLPLAEAIRRHAGTSCAIAHRDNLVIQLAMSLAQQGVRHRIIASQKTQRAAAALQAKKLGRVWIDPGARCAVASAQTLAKRDDLEKWCASVTLYVVDECFPAGTLVDGKPIETIEVGDYVTAFNEVDGTFHKRRVARLFKNPMPDQMVSMRFLTHHVIESTLGHPFWTKRGWVDAVDLTEHDEVLIDLQLVRIPTDNAHAISAVSGSLREERVLRSELLERVSSETVIGNYGSDQHGSRLGTNETQQSNGAFRSQGKDDADNAFQGGSAEGAGRQWKAFTSSRVEPFDDVRGLGFYGSMQHTDQNAEGQWLPDLLQGGLREPVTEVGNRSGRNVPHHADPTSPGSEEGRVFEWVRLGSVEVYEPRNSGTARSGSGDGYVYNIEVEEFHTYVANGVVVHNCHHLIKGSIWGKCVDRFTHPECKGLLPTATPGRADGKGLGSHHDGYADVLVALVEDGDKLAVRVAMPQESITCAPARVLMDQGFLTRYKVAIAKTHLEHYLGAVGPSGDWTPAEQKKAAAAVNMVGDVVESYKQFAAGLTAIVFARDVEEAGNIAKAYRAEGITAEVLTGETDPAVRMSIFARLESGALKIVVAVDVISEGTDIPAVGAIIFARATASLGLFLQMVGRGLRLAPGKSHCILIDHVGNVCRHRGGPDTPRTWSLSRRDKRASAVRDAIPLRVCLEVDCMQPYEKHLDACPYCGAPTPEPEKRGPPEVVEGVLSLMDDETLARLRGETPKSVDEFSREMYVSGLPGRFAGANVKRHKERLDTLDALRDAMAVWAGPYHAAGESDTEIQRRWWLTYGLDIWSAQNLSREDAVKLLDRLVTGS